jgi:hypothetical protein
MKTVALSMSKRRLRIVRGMCEVTRAGLRSSVFTVPPDEPENQPDEKGNDEEEHEQSFSFVPAAIV